MNEPLSTTHLFNSPLELGTRATFVLTCMGEKGLDLDQLVFLDFALLYAKEFLGLHNLHPVVPNFVAEIVHRRTVLPDALRLFISKGLIDVVSTKDGQFYKPTSNAVEFVGCLKSDYYQKLWVNLLWMEDNHEMLSRQKSNVLTTMGMQNDN